MDGPEGNAKVYERPERAQPSPMVAAIIIIVLAALVGLFVYMKTRTSLAQGNNTVPPVPSAGTVPASNTFSLPEGLAHVRVA